MVNAIPDGSEQEQAARRLAHLIYALQAIAFFTAITAFIGVFLNHLKREDVRNTLAESHFRWQINTFWWGLLWMVIGTSTAPLGFGVFIIIVAGLWCAYRVIKGWLRLNGGQAMYEQ